jgi:hypothetical protein
MSLAVALAAALTVPAGATVPLETVAELSSKTSRKGDPVTLRTTADLIIGGEIVVPKGSPAMGEIGDMRPKGALGQRGKLSLRPLYVTHKGQTIRLTGAAGTTGTVEAGAIIGIVILTPGFTGKSATIPAGTALSASVLRDTALTP